jgi:alpha-L-fucosidase
MLSFPFRSTHARHMLLRGTIALLSACAFHPLPGAAQRLKPDHDSQRYVLIAPGDSPDAIVRKAARVAPSSRQQAWQEREFIAFFHFGTNTFTDREWGMGNESPSVFNPTDLDARQWVRTVKDAGMKAAIIVAKHHDGLCMWPSKFTEHSVKSSPWRGGKGDVVGDVAAACREFGIKFGVYLSPWDRHEPCYGDSPKYNEHFRNQLRELLTNYGEVSEVWFDGACGEGPNGKRQVYDWHSYYALIRELQPNAVIAIMGPDVRWVGTESGYGRETEWSVVPDVAQNLDAIAAGSQQQALDGAFTPRDLTSEDLGSREKIEHAEALLWYPAETDVSIRPGWFYHADQDNAVKTPETLVDIYFSSVGRNSVLLLNIPPDRRGRIHENDIRNLMGMRKILDQTFAMDLLAGASIRASNQASGHRAAYAIDGKYGTYWTTANGVDRGTLECTMPSARAFDRLQLQEAISTGQRVEHFHLDAWVDNTWKLVAQGTTIGYKRLLRFPPVTASRVRLVIDASRTNPTIASFGLYKAPPHVTIEPGSGGFGDSLVVRLSSDVAGSPIHYTLDGTPPDIHSPVYEAPILLKHNATVSAVASLNGEACLEITKARFISCVPVAAITFAEPSSPKYPGSGATTLIDGRRSATDVHSGQWLGFEGTDMVATLDLGNARPTRKITAGFLQDQGSWVFLPDTVSFSVSADGTQWTNIGTVSYPLLKSSEVLSKDCSIATAGIGVRYIKVVAHNIGTCPAWHSGKGDKAWLFVDEIFVENK